MNKKNILINDFYFKLLICRFLSILIIHKPTLFLLKSVYIDFFQQCLFSMWIIVGGLNLIMLIQFSKVLSPIYRICFFATLSFLIYISCFTDTRAWSSNLETQHMEYNHVIWRPLCIISISFQMIFPIITTFNQTTYSLYLYIVLRKSEFWPQTRTSIW
jgi:hypothetical protein